MSWGLLLVGVIVVLLSALADVLGIGRAPGFGWKQSFGVVVGLVLIGVGWYWGRNPKGPR
jgi:hypothetical protein